MEAYDNVRRDRDERAKGRLLAATAAQHSASEAQHLAQIAHIAGLRANDLSLPTPLFYQMSDVSLWLVQRNPVWYN
jgi:hypothetical protein